MKIAVSSYSFSQYFQKGLLDQMSCIAKAKEMGFDAIEFTDLTPPDGVTEEEYARQIKAECDRVGLPVSNYTIGADFLRTTVKEEAERLKKKVDVAAILGTTSMRHDATWTTPTKSRGLKNIVDDLAAGIREVSDYAATKGIRTMVENHGTFLQDADRVETLINTVDNPNFGWLCDMGNFLCADEDPAKAYGKAAPYAFYAHAKDFIVKSGNEPDPGEGFFQSRSGNYLRGTIIGHGVVPVKQCLSILKKNGYDGYIGVEFEGIEDCIQGISIGLANLRRYVSEVYGN
ncbi:MAG TPA: sugar phosphate isomerase/epimerase [Candidatus Merdivicinus intestinavium]|nr:sugar phosphate isomerase/epimerase [Candidatus Merdivicinus intestinavium]